MSEASTLTMDLALGRDRDETALIQAARADSNAFGELCMHYANQLYSYLRARTSSDDDAADLSQQVLTKAFEAFPRYQDRGTPFAAWLFRIARNVTTDAYRRRRPAVSWDRVPEAFVPAEAGDLETDFLRREACARVRTLLSELKPPHRDLILLRFVAGLRLREIAVVVGKSEPAVHRQLIRILENMREEYDDDE